MNQRIEIYDTTLRDGSQGEGLNFSVSDKCRIAEHLDEFGVDFIEGGWPGSNPRDVAFFERAKKLKLKARSLRPLVRRDVTDSLAIQIPVYKHC